MTRTLALLAVLANGCVDYGIFRADRPPLATILAPEVGYPYWSGRQVVALARLEVPSGQSGAYTWCLLDSGGADHGGQGPCSAPGAQTLAQGSFDATSLLQLGFAPSAGSWTLAVEAETYGSGARGWHASPLLVVEDGASSAGISHPLEGQEFGPDDPVWLLATVSDDISASSRLQVSIALDGDSLARVTPDELGQVVWLLDTAGLVGDSGCAWLDLEVQAEDEVGNAADAAVSICLHDGGGCEVNP